MSKGSYDPQTLECSPYRNLHPTCAHFSQALAFPPSLHCDGDFRTHPSPSLCTCSVCFSPPMSTRLIYAYIPTKETEPPRYFMLLEVEKHRPEKGCGDQEQGREGPVA